jgi:PDZ domain-containing protein
MTTPSRLVSPTRGRARHRQRRRASRWLVVLVVALVLVVLAGAVASRIQLGDYALVPGVAQPVTGLISVPGGQAARVQGQLLLTDVGVEPVTALSWLWDQLSSTTQVVPASALTGGLPSSELVAEGQVDMAEAQLTAEAVALRQLGLPVPERDVGVVLFALVPGTPAYAHLAVGDVVASLDGNPTTSPAALVRAVQRCRPGQSVVLEVGTVAHPTRLRPIRLRLGRQRVDGRVEPLLGVPYDTGPAADGMGTQPLYQLPRRLVLASDGIGGPSAGLAFTLGILDRLAGGDLTGGQVVAVTGTIDPNGAVGEIGGLPQKTVAVERAGARYFLVPAAQVGQAEAVARRGLRVLGVRSLAQALADLRRLGGRLGPAAHGPPPGPAGHAVPAQWPSSPWS